MWVFQRRQLLIVQKLIIAAKSKKISRAVNHESQVSQGAIQHLQHHEKEEGRMGNKTDARPSSEFKVFKVLSNCLETSHQIAAFLAERKYTWDTFKSQEHVTMYKQVV